MAVGGFILGLGFALIWGSPSVASLEYGAAYNSFGTVISVSEAFSISFWLLWAGFVLFPIGLAISAYGIGAQKSSPETASTETVSSPSPASVPAEPNP